jgi:hypothetical protein
VTGRNGLPKTSRSKRSERLTTSSKGSGQ